MYKRQAPRRTARTTRAKAAEVKAEEPKTTAADKESTETKHTEAEKPAIHKEEKIMTQEALGMVETRGLTAAIEAADQMCLSLIHIYQNPQSGCKCKTCHVLAGACRL